MEISDCGGNLEKEMEDLEEGMEEKGSGEEGGGARVGHRHGYRRWRGGRDGWDGWVLEKIECEYEKERES